MAIRVLQVGKFKAKTNGGLYWTVTVKGEVIGELNAKIQMIAINAPSAYRINELTQLQQLIIDCNQYYTKPRK